MRGTWRQVVLLTAGLLGALTISVVSGMAGFRLTTGALGPQVTNNFLMIPLVVLLAVLVGIGCAVLGAALAGALFLALCMRRHLRGARPETQSAAADAVGPTSWKSPNTLGGPWTGDGAESRLLDDSGWTGVWPDSVQVI